MCLVTIGLPVYNTTSFLAGAIQSVLSQTLADWELLIVDDGSTDDSPAIAKSFSDPRIRVLTDGVNRGLPARLNQIAQLARGTYLARMDADDIMTPDRIQVQIDFMRANPKVDVVGAFAYIIDTKNRVYGIRGTTVLPASLPQAAAGVSLIHPTILARTAWFREHPYREAYRRAEDVDLWLQTIETSTFHVLASPLLFYRERGLPQRKKYLETASDTRQILRRFHQQTLKPWRFWQLILASYGKGIVYTVFSSAGLTNVLLSRRNRRLTAVAQQKAQALLNHTVGLKPMLVQVFTVPESLLFIDGQSAFLTQRGYDVRLVSAGGEDAIAFARHYGIYHYTVPFTRRMALMRDLLCLLKTYRLFRQLRPAIVHGNTPKAGLISMLAAWLAQVPVRIYEIHGFPFESRQGMKRLVLIGLEWLACQLATQVLAVSLSIRRVALAERVVPKAKIRVLHHGSCNGVDAAGRFNPARLAPQKLAELRRNLGLTGRLIGFAGRLTREKGIYELLQAWLVIRTTYPDVMLLLAGKIEPGFLSHQLLQSDDRIRAVGYVQDMPQYYALMDFLVLPTHRAGFGTVLIEAAAMARPAVVTRVTGTVNAVVDGETGLFCEPHSVDSLVRQLSLYLDNPAMVQEHGYNARQRVLENFVPRDIWTAKWQVYERLLNRSTSPVESAITA